MKKLAIIFLVCTATTLLLGVFFGFSRKVLLTTSSPSQRYQVEIGQKRFLIEHAAYLNVFRSDNPIVQWKLVYTGDFLDGDFRSVYPNYAWDSESALRVGNNVVVNDHFNDLRVINESPSPISYLLIETYADKVVLLEIAPHASLTVKFPFEEMLSCQGEFADSKKRFGYAVRKLEALAKPCRFDIKIKEGIVSIESQELKLKPTRCCAPDRPSFDGERLY